MLFLVYINDLPLCINFSNIHIFADDTKCSHQIKSTSVTIELQSDLDMLNDWSNKWNLSFNSQKCVLLKFYKKPLTLYELILLPFGEADLTKGESQGPGDNTATGSGLAQAL